MHAVQVARPTEFPRKAKISWERRCDCNPAPTPHAATRVCHRYFRRQVLPVHSGRQVKVYSQPVVLDVDPCYISSNLFA
jgi:hypothetical protein